MACSAAVAALAACAVLGAAAGIAAADPAPSPSAPLVSQSMLPGATPDFARDIAAAKELQRKGKSHDAIALLLKDHGIDPANRDVTVALAQTYSYAGEQGSAIQILDALLAATPDDGDARVILAQAYAFNHDYAAAENQYAIVLKSAPDDEDAQVGLGQTYTFEGKYAGAKELFDKVLARDPKNFDALVGLAGAEAFSGDYGRARNDYRAVLDAQPDNTDALVGLATDEYWLGDVPAAIALDDRALALDPGDSDARDLRQQLRVKVSPQLVATATTSHSNDGSTYDYQLEGRYYTQPTTSFGLVDETYGIGNQGASVVAHRFGILATYQGPNQFGADLRVVDSRLVSPQVSGPIPAVTDSVITFTDAVGPYAFSLGHSTGGVDGSVQANGGRTAPGQQTALVRINALFGSAAWTRRAWGVALAAQTASYNDGNRFHDFSADLSRQIGIGATFSVTPELSEDIAGFSNTYNDPVVGASPGYYDFTTQRVTTLSATAQKLLTDRLSIGAVGGLGLSRTVIPTYVICVPGYCPPPGSFASPALLDQHLEPYFDYEGDRFSLEGAYYDDHYGGAGSGARQVQPYAANTLDITFSIRLP